MRKKTVMAVLFLWAGLSVPVLAAEETQPPAYALAEGNYEKWIDRIQLPDYAREFYDRLVEGSDNDGVDDFLIQDTYYSAGKVQAMEKAYDLRKYSSEQMQGFMEEAWNDIEIAFRAFQMDHPEVFWLNGESHYSGHYGSDGILKVDFVLRQDGGSFDIRHGEFRDEGAIQEAIARRDSQVREIRAGNQGTDDAEKIAYFNRWLTEHNGYNSIVAKGGLSETGTSSLWGECITALEGKFGTEGPVCQGYASAFKVLCDAEGIPCVLVDGIARESHMWNYVEIDGAWYAVDVTWNDPVTQGAAEPLSGMEREDYLLVGGNTSVGQIPFRESHQVINQGRGTEVTFPNGPLLSGEKYSGKPADSGRQDGWTVENGRKYWYENGRKQGTEGRGKEIYDPDSDAWYWLDAVDGGCMAVSKDVYQESVADADGTMGKWVRYDDQGHMVKGWVTDAKGTYYFDFVYGAMAKGSWLIDGKEYFFNDDTGLLEREGGLAEGHWVNADGRKYWYEGGIRQGYDPADPLYRGKEIYDPGSDAWYWLDNVQQGARAVSKDVYQESSGGKWVRYDEQGHMVKGWQDTPVGRYYFDPVTGAMQKGQVKIEGSDYVFDEVTGILK